jgi:predicted transcriptional regulator
MKTKTNPLKKEMVVSVRIPKDLHHKIAKLAEQTNRTMGYTMRSLLLEGFLEAKETRNLSLGMIETEIQKRKKSLSK